jgi:2-polyprenyl-6-methoxyphenol hydroxylase-like FAD-dependent oxidoreductase
MTAFDTDVLILGAGPVGLTLANELLRHGVRPRLVDKAPGIREVSKAMILHVRTQEVLDKVGIAAQARAQAQPLTEVVVHAYGKHLGSWNLDGIDSPYPHPLIIGQNRTQHLLLDRLQAAGGDVQWNCEGTSFTMDSEGVTTTLMHTDPASNITTQSVVRSRWIVGAEGSNSLVRKTMGISFEGERYAGEQFVQADCRIRWALPAGRSYLFLTPMGYLMVIEFQDGLVRIFISLPDDRANGASAAAAVQQLGAAEATNEEPTLDEIAQHLARLTGFPCALTDPRWMARYRTSHRCADRFSQDRAFLAGDAGHVHVPIGGQGMNTGIQDAFNLGWKLAGAARGTLKPNVLDSYQAERNPVAQSLIRGTDFAYTGILHPSELRQRAARMIGPFLIRSERVQQYMRETLEELSITYPDSVLNLDLGGSSGPKPGERALDTVLQRAADLTTTTLNDLTRRTEWTLLIFAGLGQALASIDSVSDLAQAVRDCAGGCVRSVLVWPYAEVAAEALVDEIVLDVLHLAHGRYGVSSPAFFLLRPDSVVAARGALSLSQQQTLVRHLGTVFEGVSAAV